jgi:peptidoglycan/xylan/chitin deacetylase (PgdA/CDA1 family)
MKKKIVLAVLALPFFAILISHDFSLQKREVFYGALIVNNEEGIELLFNPPSNLSDCQVVSLLSFNFDSGEKTIFDVLPIFDAYKISGTIFLATDWLDKDGFVSKEDLSSLTSKGWEIGSRGITYRDLTAISLEEARQEIEGSKRILQSLGFKISGFNSPFGKYNEVLLKIIKEDYYYHRTLNEGLNPLPLLESGLGSPYELYYFNLNEKVYPEEVIKEIERVNRSGGWLIIGFSSYPPQSLEKILKYMRENLKLCTIEEFFQGFCLPK